MISREWMPTLTVDGAGTPTKVTLLGFNGPVKTASKGGKLVLTSPAVTPATIPCQHAWVYKLEGAAR